MLNIDNYFSFCLFAKGLAVERKMVLVRITDFIEIVSKFSKLKLN